MMIYTYEEVAHHDGKSNTGIWIIIKNIVYDVTEYINEHPGGGELIFEYAGKDATTAFHDFGHSSDARNILKHYEIGQLTEGRKVKNEGNKKKIIDANAMKINPPKRKNRRFIFPLFRKCTL